MKVVVDFCVQ
jgi:hypothetical protein